MNRIVTSLLHCVDTSFSLTRRRENSTPRLIKLRRRFHVERHPPQRSCAALPASHSAASRSPTNTPPQKQSSPSRITNTYDAGSGAGSGAGGGGAACCAADLLPRAIRLPLRIFKLSLQIRIDLLRRSLLRFFDRLRILNHNFRRRQQEPAKSKRHRLPKSTVPPQLPVLRAYRRQMRIVEPKSRHIVRNEVGISKLRIQPTMRFGEEVRTCPPGTTWRRNRHVVHRMRAAVGALTRTAATGAETAPARTPAPPPAPPARCAKTAKGSPNTATATIPIRRIAAPAFTDLHRAFIKKDAPCTP